MFVVSTFYVCTCFDLTAKIIEAIATPNATPLENNPMTCTVLTFSVNVVNPTAPKTTINAIFRMMTALFILPPSEPARGWCSVIPCDRRLCCTARSWIASRHLSLATVNCKNRDGKKQGCDQRAGRYRSTIRLRLRNIAGVQSPR